MLLTSVTPYSAINMLCRSSPEQIQARARVGHAPQPNYKRHHLDISSHPFLLKCFTKAEPDNNPLLFPSNTFNLSLVTLAGAQLQFRKWLLVIGGLSDRKHNNFHLLSLKFFNFPFPRFQFSYYTWKGITRETFIQWI